mmetsp:Transcript_32755/g.68493  ORF Transcript_32755/g.68493 Transcript_32755/m.68493 type:complete len:107 (-) Transcript_32755:75-395(-)
MLLIIMLFRFAKIGRDAIWTFIMDISLSMFGKQPSDQFDFVSTQISLASSGADDAFFDDLDIDFFMPIFKWFVGSVVIDDDSVPISELFDFATFEVECCSPISEGS